MGSNPKREVGNFFLELARNNLQVHQGPCDLSHSLIILTLKQLSGNFSVHLDLGDECQEILSDWIEFLKPFLGDFKSISSLIIEAQGLKLTSDDPKEANAFIQLFVKYFPRYKFEVKGEKWKSWDLIKVSIRDKELPDEKALEFRIFPPIKNGSKKEEYLGIFPRPRLLTPTETYLALVSDLERFHLVDNYFTKWLEKFSENQEGFFQENQEKLKMLGEANSSEDVFKSVFRGATYQELFPFLHLIDLEKMTSNSPSFVPSMIYFIKNAVGRSLNYCVSHSVLLKNEGFLKGARKFERLKLEIDEEITDLRRQMAEDSGALKGQLHWLEFKQELYSLKPTYEALNDLNFDDLFGEGMTPSVDHVVSLLQRHFLMKAFGSPEHSRVRIIENRPEDLKEIKEFLEGFFGSVSIGPNEKDSNILEVKGYNVLMSQVNKKLTTLGGKFGKKNKKPIPKRTYNLSESTKLKLRNVARTLGRVKVLSKSPLRCCTEVRIIATGTCFLDINLDKGHWHSKNVVILANKMDIPKSVEINTSGSHGICSFPTKALKNPVLGGIGQDGLDAPSGENGGNILLYAKEGIQNLNNLALRSNGGKGGNGQSGGAGGDGKEGTIGTDGKKETHTGMWKINRGTAGTDGGNGGVGGNPGLRGLGGKPGAIRVLTQEGELFPEVAEFRVEKEFGSDGKNGEPGDGGIGGAGGRDGKDYGWASVYKFSGDYQTKMGKLRLETLEGYIYNGFKLHEEEYNFARSNGKNGDKGQLDREVEQNAEANKEIDIDEVMTLANSIGVKFDGNVTQISSNIHEKLSQSAKKMEKEIKKRNTERNEAESEQKFFENKSKETIDLLNKFDKNFEDFFNKIETDQNVQVSVDLELKCDVAMRKPKDIPEAIPYPSGYFDQKDPIELIFLDKNEYRRFAQILDDLKTKNSGEFFHCMEKCFQEIFTDNKDNEDIPKIFSNLGNKILKNPDQKFTGFSNAKDYISTSLKQDIEFQVHFRWDKLKYRETLKKIFKKKDLFDKNKEMLIWIYKLRTQIPKKNELIQTDNEYIKMIKDPRFKLIIEDIIEKQLIEVTAGEVSTLIMGEIEKNMAKNLGNSSENFETKSKKFFTNMMNKVTRKNEEILGDSSNIAVDCLRKLFSFALESFKKLRVYFLQKNYKIEDFMESMKNEISVKNLDRIDINFVKIILKRYFSINIVHIVEYIKKSGEFDFKILCELYPFSVEELDGIHREIKKLDHQDEEKLGICLNIFNVNFKSPIFKKMTNGNKTIVKKRESIVKIIEDHLNEFSLKERFEIYNDLQKISSLEEYFEFKSNFFDIKGIEEFTEMRSAEQLLDGLKYFSEDEFKSNFRGLLLNFQDLYFDPEEFTEFIEQSKKWDFEKDRIGQMALRKFSNYANNFDFEALKASSNELILLFEQNLDLCGDIPQPEKLVQYFKWRLKKFKFMLTINGKCKVIENYLDEIKLITEDPRKSLNKICQFVFDDKLEVSTLKILLKGYEPNSYSKNSENSESNFDSDDDSDYEDIWKRLKYLIEKSFSQKDNSGVKFEEILKSNEVLNKILIFFLSKYFNQANIEALFQIKIENPSKEMIEEISNLREKWPERLKNIGNIEHFLDGLIDQEGPVQLDGFFENEVRQRGKSIFKNCPRFFEKIAKILDYFSLDDFDGLGIFYDIFDSVMNENGLLFEESEREIFDELYRMKEKGNFTPDGDCLWKFLFDTENCHSSIFKIFEISSENENERDFEILLTILRKSGKFDTEFIKGISLLLKEYKGLKLRKLKYPMELYERIYDEYGPNPNEYNSNKDLIYEEKFETKFANEIIKNINDSNVQICRRFIAILIQKDFILNKSDVKFFTKDVISNGYNFKEIEYKFFQMLLTKKENLLWKNVMMFQKFSDKLYKGHFENILKSDPDNSKKFMNKLIIESLTQMFRFKFGQNLSKENEDQLKNCIRKLTFFADQFEVLKEFCEFIQSILSQFDHFTLRFETLLDFLNQTFHYKNSKESIKIAMDIVNDYLPINWPQMAYIKTIESDLKALYNNDEVVILPLKEKFEEIRYKIQENQTLKVVVKTEFYKIFSMKLENLLKYKIKISIDELQEIMGKISGQIKFLDENILHDMKNESIFSWKNCWRRCRLLRLGIPENFVNQILSMDKISEDIFDDFINIFCPLSKKENLTNLTNSVVELYAMDLILDRNLVGELKKSHTQIIKSIENHVNLLAVAPEYEGSILLDMMVKDKLNNGNNNLKRGDLENLIIQYDEIFKNGRSKFHKNPKKIYNWTEKDIEKWVISRDKLLGFRSLTEKVVDTASSIGKLAIFPILLDPFDSQSLESKLTEEELMLETLAVLARGVRIISHKKDSNFKKESKEKEGGYDPRHTQILAVSMFLTARKNVGRLGEIATGEGKTLITAMLAIYLGLNRKNVNIISSSSVLALQNAGEWEALFKLFNVQMGNNCDNCDPEKTKGGDDALKSMYRNLIIYGDLGSFEGHILRDKFFFKKILSGREPDYVIVDEVDSMLLDKGAHMLYVSHPIPEFRHLRSIFLRIWTLVNSKDDRLGKDAHLILAEIHAEIEAGKLKFPKTIRPFVNSRLPIWIKNAYEAIRMQDGDLYICKDNKKEPGKICTIDKQTGVEEPNMSYSHGLHQALQMKGYNRISPETLKAYFMSNFHYFSAFNHGNLFGFTGTLGSSDDRKFIESQYGVDFFRLPRHKFRRCRQLPCSIGQTEEEWLQLITRSVSNQITNRSVLVITENCAVSKQISEILSKELKILVKMYTSSYDKNFVKEVLENKNGLPIGEIIVATNIGGRGTDIKLSKVLKDNGGIHVVLSYLPPNVRVEEQAFGRTARAGEKGTCQFVIQSTTGKQVDIFTLRKLRDRKEALRIAEIESKELPSIKIQEDLLEKYWEFHQSLKVDKRLLITKVWDYFSGDGEHKKHKDLKSDKRNILQKANEWRKGYEDVPELQLGFLNNKWALWLDRNQQDIDRIRIGDDVFGKKVWREFWKFKKEMETLAHKMNFENSLSEKVKLAKALETNENVERSLELLANVIDEEEDFNGFAHLYYSACKIVKRGDSKDEKITAKAHLKKAKNQINDKYEEIFNSLLITELQPADEKKQTFFKKQVTNELEILEKFDSSIVEILGFSLSPEVLQKCKLDEDEAKEILKTFIKLGLLKNYRINNKKLIQVESFTGDRINIPPELMDQNSVFLKKEIAYCSLEVKNLLEKRNKSLDKYIGEKDFEHIVLIREEIWFEVRKLFKDIFENSKDILDWSFGNFDIVVYSKEKLNSALCKLDSNLIKDIGTILNLKLMEMDGKEYEEKSIKDIFKTIKIDEQKCYEEIKQILRNFEIIQSSETIKMIPYKLPYIQEKDDKFELFKENLEEIKTICEKMRKLFDCMKLIAGKKTIAEEFQELFNGLEEYLDIFNIEIPKNVFTSNVENKCLDLNEGFEEFQILLENLLKFYEESGGLIDKLRKFKGKIFNSGDFEKFINSGFECEDILRQTDLIEEKEVSKEKIKDLRDKIEKFCTDGIKMDIYNCLFKDPKSQAIRSTFRMQDIPLKSSREEGSLEVFNFLVSEGAIKEPKVKFSLMGSQEKIDEHKKKIKSTIKESSSIKDIYNKYHHEIDAVLKAKKKSSRTFRRVQSEWAHYSTFSFLEATFAHLDAKKEEGAEQKKYNKKLEKYREDLADFLVASAGVLKAFSNSEVKYRALAQEFTPADSTSEELLEFYQEGCDRIPYIVLRKECMGNGAKIALAIGIGQAAIGIILVGVSLGTATPLAMILISEGISDSFYAVQTGYSGNFSWKGYAGNKAMSLALNAATLGTAGPVQFSVATGGRALLIETAKFCGRTVLKEVGKRGMIALSDWGIAMALDYLRKGIFVNYAQAFNDHLDDPTSGLSELMEEFRSSVRLMYSKTYEKDQAKNFMTDFQMDFCSDRRGSWQEGLVNLAQSLAFNMGMVALGRFELTLRSTSVDFSSLSSLLRISEFVVMKSSPFLDKEFYFQKAKEFVQETLRASIITFTEEASNLEVRKARKGLLIDDRQNEAEFEQALKVYIEQLKRQLFDKVLEYIQKQLLEPSLMRDKGFVFKEMLTRMSQENHNKYQRSVSGAVEKLKRERVARVILAETRADVFASEILEEVYLEGGISVRAPLLNFLGREAGELRDELGFDRVRFHLDKMGGVYAEII